MKTLNNKGMSLIEMLVCLSLMSVVVLLMYGLISQINNLSSESNYAVKNQNIRLEIIKTIEDDLIANKLADVEKKDNRGNKWTCRNTGRRRSIFWFGFGRSNCILKREIKSICLVGCFAGVELYAI